MKIPRDSSRLRAGIVRKFLVSIVLIGLVIGGGFYAIRMLIALRPEAERVATENPGYTVEVIEIKQVDYQQALAGYGTVVPLRTATISTEVGGVIAEFDESARVGASVQAGQILSRIDSSTYDEEWRRRRSAVEQAEADQNKLEKELENIAARLEVAGEDLRLSTEDLKRLEKLKESGVAAEQSLDRARISVIVSRRGLLEIENQKLQREGEMNRNSTLIEARKAEAALARLDVERCIIRAPFGARVAERFVEPGEFVNRGESLIRLTDIATVEIPIHVPASELGVLRVGREVEIRLPQGDEERWTGEIVRVSPEVDVVNRTVAVFVQVDNRVLRTPLLPGELVEARVQGRLYPEVVVMPRRALIDGFAYIKVGFEAERRKPSIIRALGDDLLISDGIEPGEELIVSNLELLYDGVRVITSQELNERLRRERGEDSDRATAVGH